MTDYLVFNHYYFSKSYIAHKLKFGEFINMFIANRIAKTGIGYSRESFEVEMIQPKNHNIVIRRGSLHISGLVPIFAEDFVDNFNPKWRYELRKALKNKVSSVSRSLSKSDIEFYTAFARGKGFAPISSSILELFNNSDEYSSFVIESLVEGESLAFAYFIVFENTVYYLLRCNTEKGRKFNANYTNVYFAIQHARKNFDSLFFDVGGLGKDTTHGVRVFKERMNPIKYSLRHGRICLFNTTQDNL